MKAAESVFGMCIHTAVYHPVSKYHVESLRRFKNALIRKGRRGRRWRVPGPVKAEVERHRESLEKKEVGVPLMCPVKLPAWLHPRTYTTWGDYALDSQKEVVGIGVWAMAGRGPEVYYYHWTGRGKASSGCGEALTIVIGMRMAKMRMPMECEAHLVITDSEAATGSLNNGRLTTEQMVAAGNLYRESALALRSPSWVRQRRRWHLQGADLLSKQKVLEFQELVRAMVGESVKLVKMEDEGGLMEGVEEILNMN